MKILPIVLFIYILSQFSCAQKLNKQLITIDETSNTESIEQVVYIDSVWAGHQVDFCLNTHEDRQYIAYYNANRNMVVGQRNINEKKFDLYIMPPTYRKTAKGTSTVLGWDSHNFITIGVDKDGFIHLSGNMHVNPITYFKSTKPNDISTLSQEMELVGANEKRCTWPQFMLTNEKELILHYRDGESGNGNEIYNIYSCEDKKWYRMLDVPLTDGQGIMNAYQLQPTIMKDGWYHVYWVWRDTPDCATNHDLSYMKSPDLKNWFNAFGKKIELPATFEKKSLIVDPIPIKGGFINLAAELCLDEKNNPVFTYHKYDAVGNLQLYTAQINDGKWIYKQITNWDYRWEFSGGGSIKREFWLYDFKQRTDGNYEVDYWHIKYGNGTILLNDLFENIGNVLKAEPLNKRLDLEGDFPGLMINTIDDLSTAKEKNTRYILKWETLGNNRDSYHPKPWPKPSKLYLLKLKKTK